MEATRRARQPPSRRKPRNISGRCVSEAWQKNGQGWIRTSEGVSQRIYSPPRLATSVPTRRVASESYSAAQRAALLEEFRDPLDDVGLLLARQFRIDRQGQYFTCGTFRFRQIAVTIPEIRETAL